MICKCSEIYIDLSGGYQMYGVDLMVYNQGKKIDCNFTMHEIFFYMWSSGLALWKICEENDMWGKHLNSLVVVLFHYNGWKSIMDDS